MSQTTFNRELIHFIAWCFDFVALKEKVNVNLRCMNTARNFTRSDSKFSSSAKWIGWLLRVYYVSN